MTDHKVVVSKINAQVYAYDDTAETDWNSCRKQNKLVLSAKKKKKEK